MNVWVFWVDPVLDMVETNVSRDVSLWKRAKQAGFFRLEHP